MLAPVSQPVEGEELRRLLGLATRLPRYTSYPTADRFSGDFDPDSYLAAARESNQPPMPSGLSLYVHVPFCDSLCFYCGCHKVITRNRGRAQPYLDALQAEIQRQGELFDRDREVDQIHFGGGTPTWLDAAELDTVMAWLDAHFSLDWTSAREFSIEIDPRTVGRGDIRALVDLGFNRLSFGVQDLDPEVQRASHRVLPPGHLAQLVDTAREYGVESVSLDLIYGLPHQTPDRFRSTLDRLMAITPDRLCIYRYAHLPERFRAQRLLEDHRPDPEQAVEIFLSARALLLEASYTQIGLDHFARDGDELAQARRRGDLHRNFQGYSTRAGRDLIGLGPSAISFVNGCYAQNIADVRRWEAVTAGGWAIARGHRMTTDDHLRAAVIQDLMCRGEVDLQAAARRHGIHWRSAFARDIEALDRLVAEGLMWRRGARFGATTAGTIALRVIAAVFDVQRRGPQRHSEAL